MKVGAIAIVGMIALVGSTGLKVGATAIVGIVAILGPTRVKVGALANSRYRSYFRIYWSGNRSNSYSRS